MVNAILRYEVLSRADMGNNSVKLSQPGIQIIQSIQTARGEGHRRRGFNLATRRGTGGMLKIYYLRFKLRQQLHHGIRMLRWNRSGLGFGRINVNAWIYKNLIIIYKMYTWANWKL